MKSRAPGFAAIFLCAFLAYFPAIRGGFIWDDDAHVTKPELQSLDGLRRIWFELGATQQYYPVLHSAFWVEHRLWGEAPLPYHLLNVVLHATSACLVVVFLRRLWGGEKPPAAAWLAGLIFALHPVGAESVAWISEQKNTLSTVFYVLAALAYLRYADCRLPAADPRVQAKNQDSGGRQAALYGLATFLYVLALLSKSVTSTLPAALLVVIWWRRGRLELKRDFVPLLPWLALGLGMGLFTAWVERNYLGAEGAPFALSFLERCLLAGRVICFYLAKLFWPRNLIFIYPHWRVSQDAAWQYLFPLGVAAGLAVLWGLRRRCPGGLAGFLFFIGTLFPALGFFNVFPFTFSYVADHFQYLACLGLIASVSGGWGGLLARAQTVSNEAKAPPPRSGPVRPVFFVPSLYAMAAILVACLGILTWRQSRIYRNAETLYRVTLQRNPDCWLAAYNLGVVMEGEGRTPESIAAYERALRVKPDLPDGHNNLGIIFANAGRLPEAVAQYRQAIADGEKEASSGVGPARAGWYRSGEASAMYNLGNALSKSGREEEAVHCYREAIRLKPGFDQAYAAIGRSFSASGKPDQSILFFQKALRANPRSPQFHNDLGVAMHEAGRGREAAEQFEAALRLKPDFADAEVNLGNIRREQGRPAEAIACYRQALRIKPQFPEVDFRLAIVLAEAGRLPEAIGYYQEALRGKPEDPEINYDLGVALREMGRVGEAIGRYEQALRLRPNYPEAENDLGIALAQSGQLDQSVVHFEAALRLKPDYGEADNNLALVLKALGRTAEAKARQDEADRLLGRPPQP